MNYGNYGFNLEWSELDEDLRNRKIDEYILGNVQDYKHQLADEMTEDIQDADERMEKQDELVETLGENDLLNSVTCRENAEDAISARFPMYF